MAKLKLFHQLNTPESPLFHLNRFSRARLVLSLSLPFACRSWDGTMGVKDVKGSYSCACAGTLLAHLSLQSPLTCRHK